MVACSHPCSRDAGRINHCVLRGLVIELTGFWKEQGRKEVLSAAK